MPSTSTETGTAREQWAWPIADGQIVARCGNPNAVILTVWERDGEGYLRTVELCEFASPQAARDWIADCMPAEYLGAGHMPMVDAADWYKAPAINSPKVPGATVPKILTLTLEPGAEFFPDMFEADMLADLRDCFAPGADAAPAVRAFRDRWPCKGNNLAGHLRAYGAWDDSELADEDDNLDRALWILAGDIHEAEAAGERDWYIVLEDYGSQPAG